jgi:hypothetical protein
MIILKGSGLVSKNVLDRLSTALEATVREASLQ